MRFSSALLFLAAARFATGAALSIPNQLAGPGQMIRTAVSLASEGRAVSGIQFDIEWDQGIDAQAAVGRLVGESSKILYSALPADHAIRYLIAGINQNALPDGDLLQLFLVVGAGAQPGSAQVRITHAVATSPEGDSVPLRSASATIQIQGGAVAPTIDSQAILNSASLLPGPVSPGEIVTLLGSMGTDSMLFNGIKAPILYAGSNQVNAIVPFGLDPSAPVSLELRTRGQSLATVLLPAAVAAPAIFTQIATGAGPGAILNEDFTPNSFSNPAAPDSIVMLYGTGFGTLAPSALDGQIATGAASTTLPVLATIGGIPSEVTYAGAAPGLVSGVVQINVRIPRDLRASPFTPISLRIGSAVTPPGVTVSIQ